MQTFAFETRVWVPCSIAEAFEFFASGFYLEAITPPWLRFHVLESPPGRLQSGAEIGYRLRPGGIPLFWRSRIISWDPPNRFVDEQIQGPYRFWRHEHQFRAEADGTCCQDYVRYAPPGGAFANRLFVRGAIERVFAHRRQRILALLAATGRERA